MKLLTGNDLASGDVIWWTGTGWSHRIAEAVDVGADGEAIAVREEAERRVNVPLVIDAIPGADGPVPTHIKQRIRAYGPTVSYGVQAILPIADGEGGVAANSDVPGAHCSSGAGSQGEPYAQRGGGVSEAGAGAPPLHRPADGPPPQASLGGM